MKFKNPFKLNAALAVAKNTILGGATNAVFDAVWEAVGIDSKVPADGIIGMDADQLRNGVKIIGGALIGAAVPKESGYRAAVDGLAVVGVSNIAGKLIDGWMGGSTSTPSAPSGLPEGTIGALRGKRYGKRNFGVKGLEDFQTC